MVKNDRSVSFKLTREREVFKNKYSFIGFDFVTLYSLFSHNYHSLSDIPLKFLL